MHSSDETGDERKGPVTTATGTAGGATAQCESAESAESAAQPAAAKSPAHAFRERIRRASVAAAQSSAPPSSVDAAGLPDSSAPSLVPPEQSGVHDRTSDEPEPPELRELRELPTAHSAIPAAVLSSMPVGSAQPAAPGGPLFESSGASGVRRPTPRAWPFAGGARDGRPQYHTQLGLGMPARAAAASGSSSRSEDTSESDVSDARRRMDTRDTKRSGAPHANASAASAAPAPNGRPSPSPLPGAYKITPPRPFRAHDAAKWSPTSTKPQRASLLRGEAPKAAASPPGPVPSKEPPRFAQTIKYNPSIDARVVSDSSELIRDLDAADSAHLLTTSLEPGKYSLHELAEEYVDAARVRGPNEDGGVSGGASSEEDETARARRYTPKQRPTQRRGRGHERGNAVRTTGLEPSFDHDQDQETDAESATTAPDIRIPSSRPPALPFGAGMLNVTQPGGAQVVTPDTPTQPRGRPVPRLPLAAPQPAFSSPSAFSAPSAFSPPSAAKHTGVQFHAPRSPFQHAQVATRRDGQSPLAQHEASIVVDPALNGAFSQIDPNHVHKEVSSGYQPLPSDPAAFEQFMRDQASARGSRLNWKQQATLVIPRESLEPPEERRFINPKVVAGFLVVGAASALLIFGIGQLADRNTALRTVPLDTSTSAAHTAAGGVTVIATEPSGAELLLDGAVVGNTPLEVIRPQQGQTEHTYVVRLRGFSQELVRLSTDSQPAIRVTLTPETGVP